MAYEKHNYQSGAVLMASELNEMDDAIEALDQETTQLKEDLNTKINELSLITDGVEAENYEATIPENTGTNIEYPILKGQTYKITVTLSSMTATFMLRSKSSIAATTFLETLYAGLPITDYYITPKISAPVLYFNSDYAAEVQISKVSASYVQTLLETTIDDNDAFVKNKVLTDEELFSETENGYYIACNNGVGNIMNPTKVPSVPMNCGAFEVKNGDTFVITGIGGNAGRLWCFTNTDHRIKAVEEQNAQIENKTITAPDDGYLFVNFNVSQTLVPSLVKKFGADKVDLAYTNAMQLTGIDMFGSIACLGDSYTYGGIRSSDNSTWLRAARPYPEILAKRHGITVDNFAYSGSTTKTYIVNKLPEVLSGTARSLYILCWGVNDASNLTLGTIDDIKEDYTQNADTFYGNYGKIISQIQNTFPLARLVIVGPWLFTGKYAKYNEAAGKIANHFGIGYCNPADDRFFNTDEWEASLVGGHPIQPTYTGMAYALERLLSKVIWEKMEYYSYAGLETI